MGKSALIFNMLNPKTITIYLVDGDPSGIKIAEISQWIGKAFVIPRNKLKDIKGRPEITQPAIYFLFGEDTEEAQLSLVYVGEAENLWDRLSSHDSNKNFWQTAVVFNSGKNDLDKADVKYLESRCIDISRRLKRCKLENSVETSLPNLPEHKKASMEEYLGNLRLLLSTLGYPILQEIELTKPSDDVDNPLLYCKGKGALAKGRMTNEGFIVYAGSTASAKPTQAAMAKNAYTSIVNSLLELGKLKKTSDSLYELHEDHLFRSPSGASGFVLGQSSNGWLAWKDESGETLKEIEDKNIKSFVNEL